MRESTFPRSAALRGRNPVFNANALKLGVFGINSMGCALTNVPEAHRPSWAASLEAAQLADSIGLEAIVPFARWKSYVPGKLDHRSSEVLECFAWAAAVAARTERAAIFATCHVPVFPPVLAAKQAATIDQISGGRFGLNVVAGWFSGELGMFGAELLDHEQRYAQAAEWTEIVQRVWREEAEVDHHGDHFDLTGAYFEPRPAQAPGPPLMNAGGSDRGRAFAARHSDITFEMIQSEEPDEIRATVEAYRDLARAHEREIQVWTPAYVILADDDAEAERLRERYEREGDYEAADAFIDGMVQTRSNLPEPVLRKLRRRIVEGGGGFPLIGGAETIAERIALLSDAGIDGLLLSWIEYAPGLRRFAGEVLPLLESRGLRAPSRAPLEVAG
jgi:alkanesulfonate monooxygenase SsuD/methylene tetrahydromethanopterin reductase-like flavin-dependent oxidoreductase (luciferase family)